MQPFLQINTMGATLKKGLIAPYLKHKYSPERNDGADR